MIKQLFDLVLVQYMIYLAKAKLILGLAYASSDISSLLPNKSDIGQELTK